MDDYEKLKSSEEYFEKLKGLTPNIIKDKLLQNPYDDEDIQKGANVISLSYDYAKNPKYKDSMTVKSPLNQKLINRFNHIPQNKEDLEKKHKMINTLAQEVFCAQRCVGSDALHTLYDGTYRADKSNKGKTEYHKRFLKYLKYIQDNDIAPACAVTDAKGDRSLTPSQQSEKTVMYILSKKLRKAFT